MRFALVALIFLQGCLFDKTENAYYLNYKIDVSEIAKTDTSKYLKIDSVVAEINGAKRVEVGPFHLDSAITFQVDSILSDSVITIDYKVYIGDSVVLTRDDSFAIDKAEKEDPANAQEYKKEVHQKLIENEIYRLALAGDTDKCPEGMNFVKGEGDVADFCLQVREVTQKEFAEHVGGVKFDDPNCDSCAAGGVSYSDAEKYCQNLQGEKQEWRLPSEAEWLYAAMAKKTTTYFWGNEMSDGEEYAWYAGNSEFKVQGVAQLQANPWGFYDMFGNVTEWISETTTAEKKVEGAVMGGFFSSESFNPAKGNEVIADKDGKIVNASSYMGVRCAAKPLE